MTALSAAEVHRLARVSYRQIDYWSRTHLLRPAFNDQGSGVYRSFSETETRVAFVLGRLSANSISPSCDLARGVANHVREYGICGSVGDRTGLIVVDLDALEDPFLARVA